MRFLRHHFSPADLWEAQFGWLIHRPIPLLKAKKNGLTYSNVTHHKSAFSPNRIVWYLLLAGWLFWKVYSGFYMTTHVFAATKGIPLDLTPELITSTAALSLQQGNPLIEGDVTVINPSVERVRFLQIDPGGDTSWITLPNDTGRLHGRKLVIVIIPKEGTCYQDVVSALDYIRGKQFTDYSMRNASLYLSSVSDRRANSRPDT